MAESDETARAEVARFEQYWPAHVRFGSQADLTRRNRDVRFTAESGHSKTRLGRPLCANSRHPRLQKKGTGTMAGPLSLFV
jgi:hypothetical protein